MHYHKILIKKYILIFIKIIQLILIQILKIDSQLSLTNPNQVLILFTNFRFQDNSMVKAHRPPHGCISAIQLLPNYDLGGFQLFL